MNLMIIVLGVIDDFNGYTKYDIYCHLLFGVTQCCIFLLSMNFFVSNAIVKFSIIVKQLI